MKKWIYNLYMNIRLFVNNTIAIINRQLCAAGLGGKINGWTELQVKHVRNGKVVKKRKVLDKVITKDFVNDIVDVLQGKSGPLDNIKNYKYHASGTGTTAESDSQTSLITEVGSRVTGTQAEDAANQYQSVATITYTGNHAITEHGLFNASSNGILMDRTLFPAVNVQNGDSIQFTFTVTFQSGS